MVLHSSRKCVPSPLPSLPSIPLSPLSSPFLPFSSLCSLPPKSMENVQKFTIISRLCPYICFNFSRSRGYSDGVLRVLYLLFSFTIYVYIILYYIYSFIIYIIISLFFFEIILTSRLAFVCYWRSSCMFVLFLSMLSPLILSFYFFLSSHFPFPFFLISSYVLFLKVMWSVLSNLFYLESCSVFQEHHQSRLGRAVPNPHLRRRGIYLFLFPFTFISSILPPSPPPPSSSLTSFLLLWVSF